MTSDIFILLMKGCEVIALIFPKSIFKMAKHSGILQGGNAKLIAKILVRLVLVKLIGVNKGRRVTLKYFSILIKVSRKHRLIFVQSFAR